MNGAVARRHGTKNISVRGELAVEEKRSLAGRKAHQHLAAVHVPDPKRLTAAAGCGQTLPIGESRN